MRLRRPSFPARLLLAAISFAAAPGIQGQEAASPQPITVEASLFSPSWGSYELSPDGSRLAFTQSVRDPVSYETTSHIHLYDIASGEMRQLDLGDAPDQLPAPRQGPAPVYGPPRSCYQEASHPLRLTPPRGRPRSALR